METTGAATLGFADVVAVEPAAHQPDGDRVRPLQSPAAGLAERGGAPVLGWTVCGTPRVTNPVLRR
jgi:hypothetical protein